MVDLRGSLLVAFASSLVFCGVVNKCHGWPLEVADENVNGSSSPILWLHKEQQKWGQCWSLWSSWVATLAQTSLLPLL